MKLNNFQRRKLKKLLMGISTPEEQEGLQDMDIEDLAAVKELDSNKLDSIITSLQETASSGDMLELRRDMKALSSSAQRALSSSGENVSELQQAILKGLRDLQNALTQNAKKSALPADWSGFFKDAPTMLAQIGQNTGGTQELIRNLKWNASQQIRDVNGSPINPAIAGFGITATFDDVKLTYTGSNITQVDYYAQNELRATLVLSYTGSNLTEVRRTA